MTFWAQPGSSLAPSASQPLSYTLPLDLKKRQLTTSGSHAYTAVNARRTLTRLDPPPQPSPQPTAISKVQWPQPVRDYVSRAFMADNLIPGIDQIAVSAKLKQVITDAAEKSILDKIDWPHHPLPQELISMERSQTLPIQTISYAQAAGGRTSLKRKSPEPSAPLNESNNSITPPWRKKNGTTGLAERMTYPAKAQPEHIEKKQKQIEKFRAGMPTSKFNDLEKRRERFNLGNGPLSPHHSSRGDSPTLDANKGPVVGTCQTLEKSYFRLTAPPKPETVRPLHILKQAIQLVISKWKDQHNYGYACDQFKSMRQDLTVQHIKNDFTVRVYEAHARIALEKGDLGEYNQCQTQLRALYKQKLGGCPGEFMAYRIFYFIHTCNRTGMNDVLADLTLADKQHPAVLHALKVRSALATGNYHKFFSLYDDPPNMGGYLMDMFVTRERVAAVASICRA